MRGAAKVLAAAQAEALKNGVSASLVRGSKHDMIEVRAGSEARKFTIDLSKPGKSKEKCDWARQNVRRIARELKS
ncbi:hypothetical protein CPT_Seuss79 [Caulobacter phage Seuss]|uniref:Uncharacterized protein n=1 Tax=Caulobacter phage Seuss TaxID=1675601 RepID=A0A0K1LN90_9CAUD|nr:hypothetical protein HOR08_gp079 [Caulobacter phage Seuss]AKU43605.1 hypothetical protein CPT_Seuss79 [Caulobacter phage Seuss]